MIKQKLSEQELEDLKSWQIPHVEDTRNVDENWTNALNRKSDWKYEPAEPEEEILPPTAEEIEAIRQAAYQDGFEQGQKEGFEKGQQEGLEQGHAEGFEKGREEGHQQGLDSGEQEIKEKIAIWHELVERLHQPVENVEQELERELVQLSVSLARAVIRTEVSSNQNIIFQALSEGLKVLPIHENMYQIHLHPDDIVLIKEHFSSDEIEKHNWVFVESPQMSRGGCDITTQSNAVDVSIERRSRDVLDRFLLEQGLSQVDTDSE